MSTGVSVRNVNGLIEIKHPQFKLSYPQTFVNVVESAVTFARNLPPEAEAPIRRRSPRVPRAKAAKAEAPAAVATAPAAEKPAREKKAKPAGASAAPAVPKIADLLSQILANGVTQKAEVVKRLVTAGHKPGPIAIYLSKASERGQIVVKNDEVSLPS